MVGSSATQGRVMLQYTNHCTSSDGYLGDYVTISVAVFTSLLSLLILQL